MIKHVIHIADIHIPNLEDKRPFKEMLKVFLGKLSVALKQYKPEEIRIVIAGDVFNQKIKTSNEASMLFHFLLNYLNVLGLTIIFAGNHDALEKNHDRKDSITPTFEINSVYPNVQYADKDLGYQSGCIVDDGVVWVLYSMFDDFRAPDITSYKEKYPNHKFIGLYHGEVSGATTDAGTTMTGGINTDLFKGLDAVMAGHIHQHQTIRRNGIPIVYAGSLFQKDQSENISGHGYVLWNIEDMSYELREIPNKHSIFHLKVTSYDDVTNDKEELINA